MLYESIIESLASLLTIVVLAGLIYLLKRLFSDNTLVKEIIEAEKQRQEYSDIQNGLFTRLYTMPYCEDITGHSICAYCEEHLPKLFCKASESMVRISETRSGLSGEVRELRITHLRQHNITAIELSDPNEIEYNGRYRQPTVRSSIDDKGFSKDIREMIRQLQQQAIFRKNQL